MFGTGSLRGRGSDQVPTMEVNYKELDLIPTTCYKEDENRKLFFNCGKGSSSKKFTLVPFKILIQGDSLLPGTMQAHAQNGI